jgi:uncharacterized membrane protein YraQ (UPF0718 family)
METLFDLFAKTLGQVWYTFVGNWPYLLASILIAVTLKRTMDSSRVSAFLLKYRKAGVAIATLVAVGTPLCSCGTTAVVLGMMANLMPWAPIVAFMVASPLSSPQELFYSAGLFGWPFAIAFFLASIALGLSGGAVAGWLDRRGWLRNQVRFLQPRRSLGAAAARQSAEERTPCSCQSAPVSAIPLEAQVVSPSSCDNCGVQTKDRFRRQEFLKDIWLVGRRLIFLFLLFAFVGYFLNNLIPSSWMTSLFGSGKVYSVPLAATMGVPLYLNSEASLPLVRSMIDNGMSQGAALAFLITGAGTSVGAVAGALTIARWRVIGVVVAVLWLGAVLFGFLYDLIFALGFLVH